MSLIPDYFKAFPFSVTVCDCKGVIVYMNDASIHQYKSDGGAALLGKSLIDCHPEPSRSKLLALLEKPKTHTYISENNAHPLFVVQSPWMDGEKAVGIIELLIPLDRIPDYAKN